MRNIKSIFKENPQLLDFPEIQNLLEYCEELESKSIDNIQEKGFSKENILIEMVREIKEGCDIILNDKDIDYKISVQNLKDYISSQCKEYNIWL